MRCHRPSFYTTNSGETLCTNLLAPRATKSTTLFRWASDLQISAWEKKTFLTFWIMDWTCTCKVVMGFFALICIHIYLRISCCFFITLWRSNWGHLQQISWCCLIVLGGSWVLCMHMRLDGVAVVRIVTESTPPSKAKLELKRGAFGIWKKLGIGAREWKTEPFSSWAWSPSVRGQR